MTQDPDHPNRKSDSLAQISYKSKPYSNPDHHMVNTLVDEGEEEEFPKIIDNCFSVDILRIIFVI